MAAQTTVEYTLMACANACCTPSQPLGLTDKIARTLREMFRPRRPEAAGLHGLSEHQLRDLGVDARRDAWEDTVGFWRDGRLR